MYSSHLSVHYPSETTLCILSDTLSLANTTPNSDDIYSSITPLKHLFLLTAISIYNGPGFLSSYGCWHSDRLA